MLNTYAPTPAPVLHQLDGGTSDRDMTSGLHPLWVADRCLRLTLTPGLPAQQDCKARLAPTAVSN
eukprot:1160548-Pelagomonas_calceolata.AAC.5